MGDDHMIQLDADVRNADWIKTLSWDLPTEIDSFWKIIGEDPAAGWAHFQTLPAFEPMPQDLRVEVERRLSIEGLTEHLAGKHDQKTHGKGGGAAPTSNVPPKAGPAATAAFVNSQSARFHAEGGTIEAFTGKTDLYKERAEVANLYNRFERDNPYGAASKGEQRAHFGIQMTSAALQNDAVPGPGAERRGVIARTPDGHVAGAVLYLHRPGSPAINVEFLGSTGVMHGTGSALMAPVIKDAASRGLGLGGMSAATARPMWNRLGAQPMSPLATGNVRTSVTDDFLRHGMVEGVLPSTVAGIAAGLD
jgi:hypothetical protein